MEIFGTNDALIIIFISWSLVVGGCVLLLASLVFQWRRKRCSASSSHDDPPSSLPLPPGTFGFLGVGETFKYFNALRAGDPSRFLLERTAKYASKTFKTTVFFTTTAVVQGVAANRFIAAAENKQQLVNSWPQSILRILGEHIPVTKHGAAHRRLRQIMASCLGPLALRKLVRRADHMTHLHFATCWQPETQVSILSLISRHLFHIACSLLAGADDESLVAQLYVHFKTWIAGVVSVPLDFPGTAHRRAKNAKQMLVREMDKLIDSRQQTEGKEDHEKEQLQAAGGDENLLGMLMRARDENGSFLNREELQDIILFLLFAGYDTSTATLSFVLKFLEQNPACYHRLLQEHKAINSQKNPGERLTWEDIQNMRYTWAVIQETMRLRPAVSGGFKEAKDDIDFDGYRIPKGWKMFFSMLSTHEDELCFPEPRKFDPSRFTIEKSQARHVPPPYAYVPFGIGPHSCPGGDFARMTMSIYLYHISVGKFKWKSTSPNEKLQIFPLPKLAEGYPAKIFIEKQP